jgi:hypothetical protein
MIYYWGSLNTLDWPITCLLFCITITCQKFQIKKLVARVKISNLNKYSAICCRIGKGTTIILHSKFILSNGGNQRQMRNLEHEEIDQM